jgi:hypothetical protein
VDSWTFPAKDSPRRHRQPLRHENNDTHAHRVGDGDGRDRQLPRRALPGRRRRSCARPRPGRARCPKWSGRSSIRPPNKFPAGNTAGGALACWDDIRIVAADGRDAAKVAVGPQQIAFVSPSPGTPIGRNAQITVELARIDYSLPPAYHPCDWPHYDGGRRHSLGVENRIETESIEDRAGSVDPMCIYRSPGDTRGHRPPLSAAGIPDRRQGRSSPPTPASEPRRWTVSDWRPNA